MKILHVNFQGSGVGHFRHWLPAAELRRLGHEVIDFPNTGNAIAAVEKETNGHIEEWLTNVVRQIDVMHIGYTTSEPMLRLFACAREYAAQALHRNVPLITDIDDDILHVPPYNAAFSSYHGGSQERRIARMQLQISDAVTVSTAPLMASLHKLCKHTYVLPNCFNPANWETYPIDPNRGKDKSVRLLFAGGRGRVGDIDTLQEPLEAVMATHPNLRLFFLGCMPAWAAQWMEDKVDPKANRTFLIQGTPLQTYWAVVKRLAPDIIVNPLELNDFNRSKSCIKAWDAVLGGAAYIGTDYPTHDPIPDDAMYKCLSPLQWTETLTHLIENAEARQAKATTLKEWALENYQIGNHIQSWVDTYERCVSRPVIRELEDTVGG